MVGSHSNCRFTQSWHPLYVRMPRSSFAPDRATTLNFQVWIRGDVIRDAALECDNSLIDHSGMKLCNFCTIIIDLYVRKMISRSSQRLGVEQSASKQEGACPY